MSERARRLEAVIAALAVAGLAALFVIGASGLRGETGRFPQLVGTVTAILALAEAGSRALAPQTYGAPPRRDSGSRRRAALLLVWFVATLAGLYFFGVVVATTLLAAVYFRLFAGWRFLPDVAAGFALAAAIYLAFGLVAGFRLHRGVLPMTWF